MKNPNNMKTPKQIKEYIRKQSWYESFRNHVNHSVGSLSRHFYILFGKAGEDTIRRAFPWDKTLEGAHFWIRVDRNFREWYYGEE